MRRIKKDKEEDGGGPLLQPTHQEQIRQIPLEGSCAGFAICRQTQRTEERRAGFRSFHDHPRLFAVRCNVEAADLDAGRFALLQEHVVTQGERLDNIAAQYLGDPEAYWRLCDANNAMRPEELTETIGRQLRITLPQGIPAQS